MTRRSEERMGFWLQIVPAPGLTPAREREIERCLEDYADSHGLRLGGHQLAITVSSDERSLTTTDQVDLVDWLVSRSGISAIRLGPLTAYLEQAAGDAFMLVQALDLALIGLTLLYRSRRVSAELYLQILGGFVRPAIVH